MLNLTCPGRVDAARAPRQHPWPHAQHSLLCAAHQKQTVRPPQTLLCCRCPASATEGYCFAHREGSGSTDAAVKGEGRGERKGHHRARVSWRAKGQCTQIEAPFAMNEAGTFGAPCLRVCSAQAALAFALAD